MTRLLTLHECDKRLESSALLFGQPGDVDVGSSSRFQYESHEFSTPLQDGPVIQLIGFGHCAHSSRRGTFAE